MPRPGFHIDDERIEQYALGTLPDADVCPIEEHLLVCHRCQDSLAAAERFIAGMRSAGPKLRAERARRTPEKRFYPIAAAVALLAATGWWAARQQPSREPPVAVMLAASRGEPAPAVAPAGRRIAIATDAPSPAGGPWRFVVVDSVGRTRAETAAAVEGNRATAVIGGLAEGLYFVRLYDESGAIAREYRMQVR